MPYWAPRPGTLYGEACLKKRAAVDVSPVSMVPSRFPVVGVGVEQGETREGRSLDAAIPRAALRELMHVDTLLNMRKVSPREWTVRSAQRRSETHTLGGTGLPRIGVKWRAAR